MRRRTELLGCVVLLTGLLAAATGEPEAKPAAAGDIIDAIAGLNVLVGEWRGVGQPKRGSQQGAWQERGGCVWELTKEHTGLRWSPDEGRLWTSALFSFQPADKTATAELTLPDKSRRTYSGKLDDRKLIVESEADSDGQVHRLTLTVLNENRIVVLFEKRAEKQSFYSRVAEIAFQRVGTRLAAVDGSGPKCVVTGGQGTIPVMHKGKTYYVCCTGCRDAFQDDPEGILAAWAEKQKSKK